MHDDPVLQVAPDTLPTLSAWAQKIAPTPLQIALASAAKPSVLSLALGLPDPTLLPHVAISEAARRVALSNRSALQYSIPHLPLKEHIRTLLMEKGVECPLECIFLTQGAQQALNLLSVLLLNKRSLIVEEKFSYPGFQSLTSSFSPEVLTVSTSARDGIDVDALEILLSRSSRPPALIYVMPNAHNPLGVTMSIEKRIRLASLAREFKVPLIEDDPYGELFYDERIPPIRSIESQWVYYVGTFSKLLGPSLRVGWIVAPEKHVEALSVIKENCDLNIMTYPQCIVNEYLDTNDLTLHLAHLRSSYKERRAAMNCALSDHMPSGVKWHVPSGGIFFWIDLPDGLDATALLIKCLEEQNVAFLPSQAFSRGNAKSGMRLNFSHPTPDQLVDGVRRVGTVLNSLLQ
jgi:2-aminoadipate transaminase